MLGVAQTATSDEIKAAYRRRAKVYHPDVCEDPRSKETFQILNTAYKVLMHPQKRRSYDQALTLLNATKMSPQKLKTAFNNMARAKSSSPHAPHVPIPKKLPKGAIKFLFAYGVFIGVILLTSTISLILSSLWPFWMGWMAFVGLVLIADGTQGLITNNESYILKLGNRVRKLYS